ncbi:MAG: AbrB/MazE/SpoVT family DNA-binding domain-containing protein [bacterium]
MTQATIGSRYQIVIPRREREALKLKPRMKVEVSAENGCAVVRPVAKGYRGIGRDLADGKNTVNYVRELREEWGRRG